MAGFCGVEDTLVTRIAPEESSTQTMSVKVPPVSMPIRSVGLPVMRAQLHHVGWAARSQAHAVLLDLPCDYSRTCRACLSRRRPSPIRGDGGGWKWPITSLWA